MKLQSYRVELVTEEPATLGIESETAFRRDVYRYVPGIVLRGALAAVWIGRNGPPEGPLRVPFRKLFEVGLRPGPLLPDGGYLRPLSVARCKYPPDEAHAQRSLHDQAFEERPGCPVDGCGRPVETGRGEVEFDSGRDPVFTMAHTPHDNQRGVAVDGGLHARHYLRPGTRFTGHLSGPADAFLDSFVAGGEVWLGGRRTVAGRARLTLTPEPPEPVADVPAGEQVALRLMSPGVFVDDAGRPNACPIPELAAAVGVPLESFTVQRRWWRPVTIRGWHMATGLPKPTDHAAAPGSIWLVRVDAPISGDRLTAVSVDGLGLRRAEGFGRIHLARQPWERSPQAVPEQSGDSDRAVALAARLWLYLAPASAAPTRRAVHGHLRELAGTPVGRWGGTSEAFWATVGGRDVESTGIRDAVSDLTRAEAPELVRDVRHVLEAAARPPVPQWLQRALATGAREETRR